MYAVIFLGADVFDKPTGTYVFIFVCSQVTLKCSSFHGPYVSSLVSYNLKPEDLNVFCKCCIY